MWFHVDGAYGAPAVIAAEAPPDLAAMSEADSVAFDPHKWLYAPLEAGCAFVRDPAALKGAFSYHPAYYHFDSGDRNPPPNFYELGPQNSRGFRALKVWLGLRQAGRNGYAQSIGEDIRLARELFERAAAHPELEAMTHKLEHHDVPLCAARRRPCRHGSTGAQCVERTAAHDVAAERPRVCLERDA